MRIVLTGASGFIGSRVARLLLEEGADVHALGRSETPGVPFHRCDLLAEDPAPVLESLQPTHLIHLAWNEDRRTLWNGIENLEWTAATLRLMLAFRTVGGVRAVLSGSSAEYDWSKPLLDEATTPLRPATGYGVAKRALYELVTGTPALRPLSIGWARIFFPFGPNDKPDRLLSQVIDGVASGQPIDCSQGTQVRPFIHVDDTAAATIALLRSNVEGAVNIALSETMSVRDLALAAARDAGDPALVRFGTRPLQPGEPPMMEAAVERLTNEVGFAPRYTIAEGLRATVSERLESVKEKCVTGKETIQ